MKEITDYGYVIQDGFYYPWVKIGEGRLAERWYVTNRNFDGSLTHIYGIHGIDFRYKFDTKKEAVLALEEYMKDYNSRLPVEVSLFDKNSIKETNNSDIAIFVLLCAVVLILFSNC